VTHDRLTVHYIEATVSTGFPPVLKKSWNLTFYFSGPGKSWN